VFRHWKTKQCETIVRLRTPQRSGQLINQHKLFCGQAAWKHPAWHLLSEDNSKALARACCLALIQNRSAVFIKPEQACYSTTAANEASSVLDCFHIPETCLCAGAIFCSWCMLPWWQRHGRSMNASSELRLVSNITFCLCHVAKATFLLSTLVVYSSWHGVSRVCISCGTRSKTYRQIHFCFKALVAKTPRKNPPLV